MAAHVDIEQLEIEGGFLDGLNIEFKSGLNVLIGARGTGKTSVIELIRFVTAARNHTTDAEKRSTDHIKSVLGDGEVTIRLGDAVDTITASRSLGDTAPRANQAVPRPLIFSQTEIETLGLSEAGRLRLIDSFVSASIDLANREAAAVGGLRSIFKEIATVEQERERFAAAVQDLTAISARIGELEERQKVQQAETAGLAQKEAAHSACAAELAHAVVQEEVLERFQRAAKDWEENLTQLHDADFGFESWDSDHGADPLRIFRSDYAELVKEVSSLAKGFANLADRASEEGRTIAGRRQKIEEAARAMRAEIDRFMTGAGELSRQLTQLRTDHAQRVARRKMLDDRDRRIAQLRGRRDEQIRELDRIRSERYEQRRQVTQRLNAALQPQVKITIERFGQYAEYAKALTEALRGSGMRYNDLVDTITRSVSPQELLQFMDENDFEQLSEITRIPRDRSARLIGHLREVGGVDFVIAKIEDNVQMALLDGTDYKDVSSLSAGQRCTVILSIVLQHRTRTLIIDQPEDHLDNAYIASVVVKSIKARKEYGQLIISTHNANIPVLGEAELVVEMTSDGHNGFVQVCEPLNDPRAVEAITNVMEGGAQAFAERASFYESHQL